ncbi:hypothetical protein SUGI_1066730 [Cryptomeria japonica]|nr:hypothetical protein SUGI_1066730 [Cryptomeria japonica]
MRQLNGCIEEFNDIASSYNQKFQEILLGLKSCLPGIRVVYADIYDCLSDLIKNPLLYGFETSHKGCCGTGVIEFGPTCNAKTSIKQCFL